MLSRNRLLVLTLLFCSKAAISQHALDDHGVFSYAAFPSKIIAGVGVEVKAAAAELLKNGLAVPLAGRSSTAGGNSVESVGSDLSALDLGQRLSETLSSNKSLSSNSSCARQLLQLLGNMGSDYSLQMLDSMGKPSSGILEGNLNWMGDFDECVNAHTGPAAAVQFSGQYCKLAALLSPNWSGQSVALQVGICVPSGCSNSDVTTVVNQVMLLIGRPNSTTFSVDCHPISRTLDGKALTAIVVLCVLGGVLLIATFCDIMELIRASLRRDSPPHAECGTPTDLGSCGPEACGDESSPLLTKYRVSDHHVTDPGRRGVVWQLIANISCYQNGRKLLCTKQADSSLACINGIRFLSISWIVLGHTFLAPLFPGVIGDLAIFFNQTIMSRSFQYIVNASVSVDTFFVLSGCLATYLFLKEIKARHGQLGARDWILLYLHRYIRLTGAYAAIVMIWTCLVIYLGDGPGWPTSSFDSCNVNWWTNLLYVNNFVRPKVTPCMDWTWYLANDMQFFLLTPPLAYLLYKNRTVGLLVTSLLICGSIASVAAISATHSYKMGFLAGADGSWFDDDYIKPWCRFMAYGVGILLGYIISQYSAGVSLSPFVVVSGWLVAACCFVSVVYAPFDAELGARAATVSLAENTTYNALSRFAWATGVAWLIFACCTGYGGWVNTLLSWKAFAPLARLTYCIYLIHPIILSVIIASSRDYVHVQGVLVVPFFLGTLMISSALAFVASLAFEAPILGLERYLRRGRAKSL